MLTMVIIDDNKLELSGIGKMIDYNKFGIKIVGLFSNSYEALEKIKQINPNIILTDIYMPGINGIELVKIAKEYHLDSKFIFMSCHNNFEYAKGVIDLKGEAYLLKPFYDDELISVIQKTIDGIEADREKNNELKNALSNLQKNLPIMQNFFLQQLLFKKYSDKKEIDEQIKSLNLEHIKQCIYQITLIKFTKNINVMHEQILSTKIEMLKHKYEFNDLDIFCIQTSSHTYAVLFFGKNADLFSERCFDFLVILQKNISSNSDIQFAVSNTSSDIYGLPVLYEQARKILNENFSDSENNIMFFDDVYEGDYFNDEIDFSKIYDLIKDNIIYNTDNNDSMDEIFLNTEEKSMNTAQINALINYILASAKIILNNAHINIENNVYNEYLSSGTGISNITDKEALAKWTRDFLQFLRNRIKTLQQDNFSYSIVEKIKKYINENFASEITVQDIADYVGLSARFANKLFKQIEERTIFDYLIDIRIAKAKQLLRQTDSKLYAVANSVGYNNISHFCMLFKKHTGLSPTEYKNKN